MLRICRPLGSRSHCCVLVPATKGDNRRKAMTTRPVAVSFKLSGRYIPPPLKERQFVVPTEQTHMLRPLGPLSLCAVLLVAKIPGDNNCKPVCSTFATNLPWMSCRFVTTYLLFLRVSFQPDLGETLARFGERGTAGHLSE